MYGEALYKPEMKEGNPIRLYSLDEITEIFCKLGLRICNSFADFSGKPSSDNDIQLMVYPFLARRLRPLRWEMNCVCYLLDRAS